MNKARPHELDTPEGSTSAPAETPHGLYFTGYSEEDANPDIGDSTITETAGIGGFAMAAAPAIVIEKATNGEDADDPTIEAWYDNALRLRATNDKFSARIRWRAQMRYTGLTSEDLAGEDDEEAGPGVHLDILHGDLEVLGALLVDAHDAGPDP